MNFSLSAVRPWWCIGPLALAILLAAVAAGAARAGERDLRTQAGTTPTVTIVEPSAFDWGDAGVGAAGAFGIVLLASGVVLIVQNNRRHPA